MKFDGEELPVDLQIVGLKSLWLQDKITDDEFDKEYGKLASSYETPSDIVRKLLKKRYHRTWKKYRRTTI